MRTGMLMAVCLFGAGVLRGDTARIGALVLDAETRQPLAGVEMTGSFEMDNGWQAWKGGAAPNMVRVRTDRDGRCQVAAKTNKGSAGWLVDRVPEGYYRPAHGGWWRFDRKDLFGTWQPADAVSTVLVARVGHPVPLVVRHVHDDIATPAPVDLVGKAGGRLAYDFLRGDWLPPVGRGERADVVFAREAPEDMPGEDGQKGRVRRQRLTMRFPGADDGIVGVDVPDGAVPRIRTAPENGYAACLDFAVERDGEMRERRTEHAGRDFAFRIRTRRDAQGRLVEAYYGKIYGGVEVVTARGAEPGVFEPLGEPRFGYYLNPTPLDRNLEWDCANRVEWDDGGRRLKTVPARGGRARASVPFPGP